MIERVPFIPEWLQLRMDEWFRDQAELKVTFEGILEELKKMNSPKMPQQDKKLHSGTARLWKNNDDEVNNKIRLSKEASSEFDVYIDTVIIITNGRGKGQIRTIRYYNGLSQVATVDRNWRQIPDHTSHYTIFGPSISFSKLWENRQG